MATKGRSVPLGEITPLTSKEVRGDELLLHALELLATWAIGCKGKEEDFLAVCKDAYGYAEAFRDDHIRNLRFKQAREKGAVEDFLHSLEKVGEHLLYYFESREIGHWDWDLDDTVAYLKTLTIHPEQIDTVDKRWNKAEALYTLFLQKEIDEARALGDIERLEALTSNRDLDGFTRGNGGGT